MPPSPARHCRRCRARISNKLKVCPLCRAVNLTPVDYWIVVLSLTGLCLAALWRF